MKTASLPLLLFSLCAVGTAHADVRVEVDPGAPFTEADLADAVEIRSAEAARDEVVIRVAKLGMDQLVIIVGDRSQVVTLTDHDRTASSRVVALVVTAMLDDGAPAPEGDELIAPDLAPPVTMPMPRSTLFVGGEWTRDDNGYWLPILHVGTGRPIAPNVRLVGRLGVGRYNSRLDTSATIFPLRVGLEGRSGAAGIEIGGQVTNYYEMSCGSAEWGHYEGVYGAAKVFLPMGARTRFVGELGGHFVLSTSATECMSGPNWTAYGGWIGAGVEWTP